MTHNFSKSDPKLNTPIQTIDGLFAAYAQPICNLFAAHLQPICGPICNPFAAYLQPMDSLWTQTVLTLQHDMLCRWERLFCILNLFAGKEKEKVAATSLEQAVPGRQPKPKAFLLKKWSPRMHPLLSLSTVIVSDRARTRARSVSRRRSRPRRRCRPSRQGPVLPPETFLDSERC